MRKWSISISKQYGHFGAEIRVAGESARTSVFAAAKDLAQDAIDTKWFDQE